MENQGREGEGGRGREGARERERGREGSVEGGREGEKGWQGERERLGRSDIKSWFLTLRERLKLTRSTDS